jgi:hypothetical protein
MSDSNPANPRPVLKLKVTPRKRSPEVETPPPRAQGKLGQKPGSAWSDEFKRQMQEDMDALSSR